MHVQHRSSLIDKFWLEHLAKLGQANSGAPAPMSFANRVFEPYPGADSTTHQLPVGDGRRVAFRKDGEAVAIRLPPHDVLIKRRALLKDCK